MNIQKLNKELDVYEVVEFETIYNNVSSSYDEKIGVEILLYNKTKLESERITLMLENRKEELRNVSFLDDELLNLYAEIFDYLMND